jgi:hypothetical protein
MFSLVTPSVVTASSNKNENRRDKNSRKIGLNHIKESLSNIRKNEVEYSKSLLKTIIPVRVTFNTKLTDRLKESMPFKIEIVKNEVKISDEDVKSSAELNEIDDF